MSGKFFGGFNRSLFMIQVCENTLAQKCKFHERNHQNESWKLSYVTFWPEPNFRNSHCRKALNLKLFCNWLALYFSYRFKKDFQVMKNQNIEVWRKLRRMLSKIFFTQPIVFTRTILEKMFEKKEENLTKLHSLKKIWDLLVLNFWQLLWKLYF